MDEPEPKSPEFPNISNPAIRPCNASSIEATDISSRSRMLICCIAPDTSRLGIANVPSECIAFAVTTTSSSTAFSFIFILNLRLSLIETSTGSYPTKLTLSLLFTLFIESEKFPLKSVIVAFTIRPLASTSVTCAPIISPSRSEETFPVITSC